jgi:hypothetical protein
MPQSDTHFGKLGIQEGIKGKNKGYKRLARVNGWTIEAAKAHATEAFEEWNERSEVTWQVDWQEF